MCFVSSGGSKYHSSNPGIWHQYLKFILDNQGLSLSKAHRLGTFSPMYFKFHKLNFYLFIYIRVNLDLKLSNSDYGNEKFIGNLKFGSSL